MEEMELVKPFKYMVWDTREIISPETLFLCLSQHPQRQVEFATQALRMGASQVLAKKTGANEVDGVTYLPQPEFQIVIGELGASFYDHPAKELELFGITGTNGKTTTAWFLYQLMQQAHMAGMIGTLGEYEGVHHTPMPWTTPESPVLQGFFRRMVDRGIKQVAMEVSSHGVVNKRIAHCQFRSLAFTNLSQDHLDFHDSMEDYYAAKKEFLTDYGEPGAVRVIFADTSYGQQMARELRDLELPVVTVGEEASSDYRLEVEEESLEDTRFLLHTPQGVLDGLTQVFPRFNIYDLCIAAAMCLETKTHTLEKLEKHIATVSMPPGRFERVVLEKSRHAFVDFAHTPDALEKLCQVVRDLKKTSQEITLVFGCGGDRDRDKRSKMGKIAAELCDNLVLTSDNSRSEDPEDIIHDITQGIPESFDPSRVYWEADRAQAIKWAYETLKPNGILVVAGKGHEQTQTDRAGTRHFSDQEELNKLWGSNQDVSV